MRFMLYVLLLLIPVVSAGTDNDSIQGVSLNISAFNPSRGEQVKLSYTLSRPETVTIRIYDPDGGLVRTLLDQVAQAVGKQEIGWDGLDDEKQRVPDEAYTFTIETASGAVHDPTTSSGGTVGDITDARFDEGGTVTYKLPAAARVMIRLGLHNGPMLKTLVDWKPRVAGEITEYWDGYDADKLIKVRDRKDFSALITYVALPELTVISYGNDKEIYRDYKLGRGKDRPRKPERPSRSEPTGQLQPAQLAPPAWFISPRVSILFPNNPEADNRNIPTVQDAIDVRIDVAPTDREQLLNDQFEVILFVNNVFFAEAERGYLPLNWHWELQQLPPGEHLLTVNVSSFKGQVGVASRKIRIVRPEVR